MSNKTMKNIFGYRMYQELIELQQEFSEKKIQYQLFHH